MGQSFILLYLISRPVVIGLKREKDISRYLENVPNGLDGSNLKFGWILNNLRCNYNLLTIHE